MDTKKNAILAKPPVFTNKTGEELSLFEVTKKKITSITIAYLRKNSWNKFFKEIVGQNAKQLTITDKAGITIDFIDGHVSSTMINFSNKKEWEKFINYDVKTIRKSIMSGDRPYKISFHAGSIKKIDWI